MRSPGTDKGIKVWNPPSNYGKEIVEVINNMNNDINLSKRSTVQNQPIDRGPIHQRLHRDRSIKDQKVKDRLLKKKEDEVNGLTFSPNINNFSFKPKVEDQNVG